MVTSRTPEIGGLVAAGFEPVRDAFLENFSRRKELGGACCIYRDGEKVVDLWGGVRNKTTGERWEEDTMVLVHSTTKGPAAMTLAVAHSRGWLDYEERVCSYWPEFAQGGKERVTIRQLLAHQAGLHAFDEPVDRAVARRSRSAGRRHGSPEAGLGARDATGLSRHRPRVLRERTSASGRSAAPKPSDSSSRTRLLPPCISTSTSVWRSRSEREARQG